MVIRGSYLQFAAVQKIQGDVGSHRRGIVNGNLLGDVGALAQIFPAIGALVIAIVFRGQSQGEDNFRAFRQGLTLGVLPAPFDPECLLGVVPSPLVGMEVCTAKAVAGQGAFCVDLSGFQVADGEFAASGVPNLGVQQTADGISILVVEGVPAWDIRIIRHNGVPAEIVLLLTAAVGYGEAVVVGVQIRRPGIRTVLLL